ncbi:MAG: galactose mutarotase [Gammaproteobacteria bacterium]|nr:galactose mutarotase [Gammaproteobacteria bacterium]
MKNLYQAYTLVNRHNMSITIGQIGAVIQSVKLPDGTELVLGFENLADYKTKNTAYLGVIVGRICNRIANAKFKINDLNYQLEKNEYGKNCLHSGSTALHQVSWDIVEANERVVKLHYFSPSGEAGFPGNLDIYVTYQLDDNNALQIDYHATTDQTTPLDLTNHTYWNLAGSGQAVVQQEAKFYSSRYLETDSEQIPTGQVLSTQNTALDFHNWQKIGKDLDHYFILDNPERILRLAAEFRDPQTRRGLQVYTDQHGFQFYTGNHLTQFPQYGGFCVETHNYPNAVNQLSFPSCVITPEKPYRHTTVYQLTF